MKNRLFYSLLLLAFVSFTACDNDDDASIPSTESTYFVFGYFYGECFGEQCIEIFKIENETLAEDTLDNYPNSSDFNTTAFVLLSDEKYQLVSDLPAAFPMGLLDETETVLGIPDAGDWGGVYVEYHTENSSRFWLIDQMQSNIDSDYHAFVDAVNAGIQAINE